MEVIPACRELLARTPIMKRLEKLNVCSGLYWTSAWTGSIRSWPSQLLLLRRSARPLKSVFQKRVLPEDPTIYLVAASRTDPTVAPEGCDCLKIFTHTYIRKTTSGESTWVKERILTS